MLTYPQVPEGYVKGEVYRFFANATNTGAATININGLGSRSILRADGTALSAGEIVLGQVVTVVCDGANFLHQSVGSRFFKDSVSIIKDGDAILTLEDTGAPATTYRSKNIYSSRNVNGGNDWLFRSRRPSDGAIEDFYLKSGQGGIIYTTGNFNPDLKASLNANVSFNRVVVSENGTGNSLQIGNDAAMGDVDVANTIGVRGLQDGNQAFLKMGASTRFGYDGGNWIAGGGGNLFIQPGAGGSYGVWHSGNFTPDSKASLNAQVRFNGIWPSSSEAYFYSDGGSNNIRFRAGAGPNYKYMGLNDDGTLQIFQGGVEAAGDVHATGAVRANGRVIVGEGQTNSFIEMRDTDEGTRFIHNNSNLIGFLGKGGDWIFRVDDNGSVWTKQFGDLNTRIETRAADFANDRAGYRVAKTGDTMTGDLQITKTYPMTRYLYPGVRDLAWQVRENGGMYLWDYTANNWNIFIGPSGEVQTRQLGDLNNRIEGRASAFANERVAKTGDTMTGDLQLQKAYPNLRLHYPGVKIWDLHVRENGYLYFAQDGLQKFDVYMATDGNIAASAWGGVWLTDHINNRASAYANTRQANLGFTPVRQGGGAYQQGNTVYLGWDGTALRAQVDSSDLERIVTRSWLNPLNDIRMAYAGDLNSTWNDGALNFAEPYGGACVTTMNWIGQGGLGSHVAGARWRYIQKQDSYGNWYTVGYA
ncbi:hypothetical protein ASF18_11365 [Methylobacterium sp. Leaf89]|nr:hypothetical protein ASF18_11365 [Methylobacterium sp. Leaf89]